MNGASSCPTSLLPCPSPQRSLAFECPQIPTWDVELLMWEVSVVDSSTLLNLSHDSMGGLKFTNVNVLEQYHAL